MKREKKKCWSTGYNIGNGQVHSNNCVEPIQWLCWAFGIRQSGHPFDVSIFYASD